MNELSNVILGDLVEFQRGFDLPKSEFKKGSIPVISSNGILGYHNVAKVKAPGITIGRSGTVGLPHFIKEDFFPHNTSLFIKDFKGNNPKYIFYLLKTLRLNEYGSGSGVPTMNRNHLHPIQVKSFLDSRIQSNIEKVLSDLDAKIEINNKINVELESMAKLLYDYWFVQFEFPIEAEYAAKMGFPKFIGKPYKSSGGKMVWNEELKREIPEGWEVKGLKNIIENIVDYRGKTPNKLGHDWSENKDDIIALSAKHVKNGKLVNLNAANRVNENLYTLWMKSPLKIGDILMTSEAPCGEFFYLIGNTKYCLSQRLFAIRANLDIVHHSYLYYELSSGNGYSQIQGKMSGSTVFGIRQDELRTVKVLVPNMKIQTVFAEKTEKTFLQIRNNEYQNQKLAELRDWLLPMLMNGQIKVADAKEQVKVKEVVKETQIPKSKNDTYSKIQLLYTTIWANKEIDVKQGEMATAKDVYLLDRIYGIETGFQFKQHNWGSFDPEEKKLLNTKQYFHKPNFPNSKAIYLDLKDDGKLLQKIPSELKKQISEAIREMNVKVFNRYFGTQKAEKKELFATILKCIEDRKSLDLAIIREEMSNWKIKQDGKESTKAEKFSEADTNDVLGIIVREKWFERVMK